MPPVSTPPEAIVCSSGRIPITRVIKAGVFSNPFRFTLIWIGLGILCPLLGLV